MTSDHTLWKMSRNASENVELGHLTTELKETYEDNHQEDDCEEEEEGREEEMSLLGVEDSPPCPPVQCPAVDNWSLFSSTAEWNFHFILQRRP